MRPLLLLTLIAVLAFSTDARAIVGGAVATRDYPHMAAMETRQDDGTWRFTCGASLVRPRVVLTAAHCVQDGSRMAAPERFRFLIGTRDRSRGGERIGAVRAVDHPRYDPDSGAYDVALLELARPTALGAPIRIPDAAEADRFAPGTEATVIGWGATFFGGPAVRRLREGQVPIVSDADCARTGPFTADFDPPTMVCAGNLTGGEDSCQGDSGGPLMVPDAAGRLALVGDVSFGVGCAFPTQYGVYGEVAGPMLRSFVDTQAAELSPQAPPSGTGGESGATSPALLRLPRRLGSAAQARRTGRLRVLVRTSQPIRRIRLSLRRAGRVVATGRRAQRLSARGRVPLRVRAGLRGGGAVLILSARDSEDRRVRAVRRVGVRR